MTELYINNRLCDTGDSFGVRLNRQLINPGELNTKDAQYSYSITLPPTDNNHEIFNYANVEETANKFNRDYKAELIVNGVRVFVGNFRLSEIGAAAYKGNLYVPAAKGIKDIFGDRKLNENDEYRIDFKDFAEYISRYNNGDGPQMAIFPYTLYGVLPKVPLNNDANSYSARDIWDGSVRIGMQDLPPSINPLLMLKHIFRSRGYKLGGTAFDDERLTRLYMSYKNDTDYVQPWNYGRTKIRIAGVWSATYNQRTGSQVRQVDRGVSVNEDTYYVCDLFDANNTLLTTVDDNGGNVLPRRTIDDNGREWQQCQVRIPASGYYKVQLTVDLHILDSENWRCEDPVTQVGFVSNHTSDADNNTDQKMYEFRLLRDHGKGDFGLDTAKLDGTFYHDNRAQSDVYPGDKDFSVLTDLPKYFPQVDSANGQINLIDAAQDNNIVLGFAFGTRGGDTLGYKNPKDTTNTLAQVHAAKPALSWDTSVNGDKPTRLAIQNPGYWRYGVKEGDGLIDWALSSKHAIDLNGSPENYARRRNNLSNYGSANAVVWLNAGELVTLASVSEEGVYKEGTFTRYGCTEHDINFDLTIRPYRVDEDWLSVDYSGDGTAVMSWNDPVNFDTDSINLVGFLPADVKTDDFIDNFCKAFNLRLVQTGVNTFELNVKQTKKAVSTLFINLDNLASVRNRTNTPLGLPSLYKLGFTVDTGEEGYVASEDDGGGEYATGAAEEKVIEQKSNFSYGWFKNITKSQSGGNVVLPLAVISKHEVWAGELFYPDAMAKRYTGQALRFWYHTGLLNDLGADFEYNGKPLSIARVSNELPGLSELSYKNRKLSILDNYFTLLIDGGSCYTEIEGYLTPIQYEALNGSLMAMFNGDLYYIAEISGYDPAGRNKTKIKLIRKI